MSDPKLGARYANALFDAAKEKGVLEDVAEAASLLQELLTSNKDFSQFWFGPQITVDRKFAVIDQALADFPELLKNFLKLLLEKGRGELAQDILVALKERHDEESGLIRATLTTAVELGDEEVKPFVDLLKKKTDGTVSLSRKVDPNLVGGFLLHYGDRVVDASVARSIREIRRTAGA